MRILYGIQGTGNGHIARARELVPALASHVEVDVLLSGSNFQIQLPFDVRWKLPGLSLVYSASGGVDYGKTFWQAKKASFVRDVRRLPVKNYDMVISDFEPVTAWACRISGVSCLGVGHQASFQFDETPVSAQKDRLGAWVLRRYAPASRYIGFHFEPYHPNIFPPIIRGEIRTARVREGEDIVVYLPAYGKDQLLTHFHGLSEYSWHIFTTGVEQSYQSGNTKISPIGGAFAEAVASARVVICSAGFELPAELLYLKKRFAVMPIKRQYEQACNAAALARLGVSVFGELKDVSNESLSQIFRAPLPQSGSAASVEKVVEQIMSCSTQSY